MIEKNMVVKPLCGAFTDSVYFFMSRDGMNLLEILSYASRVACSYDL
jgi:hypothetical protein